MRSIRALFIFAAFLPACSDPAPVDSATDSGGDSGSDSTTGSGSDSAPTDSGSDSASGSGGETTGGPGDPVDLVCDLMRAACERQVACGHPLLNNNPGGVDACLAEQRCEAAGELLDLPNIEVDPDAVKACIAALEGASCGELAGQGLEIDAACEHYIVGTLGEGESCHGGTVSDCAPGLSCVFEDNACPGTCTVPPPACSEGSCGPDAFCAADDTCRPRAALGEACDETFIELGNLSEGPCVAGAHCESSVCVADLDAGAACWGQNPHACGEGAACVCADPDVCNVEADYTCQPAHTEGEPCNIAYECADGLYCDFDAGGRCAQRGGLGAVCGDSLGACLHPLACVDGKCAEEEEEPSVSETPLLAEGESCAMGGSCPLGTACTCDDANCNEKHCVQAPGLGESCEAQMHADVTLFACSEGLCDILAGYTCVLPAAAGEPCPVDGLTVACASLVCLAGKCASVEQTLCQE